MKCEIALALSLLLPFTGHAAGPPFKDVPRDHWAADSVAAMARNGVLKGYPDGSFKGDRCVTRYELAAALEHLVYFWEQSRKPLIEGKGERGEGKAGSVEGGARNAESGISSAGAAKPKASPRAESRDRKPATTPAGRLAAKGFLPKDGPLLRDQRKPVRQSEVADAFAAVLARMSELDVIANPPQPLPDEEKWPPQ